MDQFIKLYILFVAITLLQACGGGGGGGGGGGDNITLTWDAPTESQDGTALQPTELVQYKLYYGNTANSLTNSVTFDGLANPNSYTIPKSAVSFVASNTYYLALTVINDSGIESSMSEIVTYIEN